MRFGANSQTRIKSDSDGIPIYACLHRSLRSKGQFAAQQIQNCFGNEIMRKKEAFAIFREEHLRFCDPTDIPAKRQAFANFIDALHRNGEITDKQANTWTYSF